MLLTSTEVKAILGLSTSVNTYDRQIDYYIPIVAEDIAEITNHRFHEAYHWVEDDGLTITSSNDTITLDSDSTYSFFKEFSIGDTIDICGSYFNDGYYTISSITSSFILIVSEPLKAENSTDYDILTYIHKCKYNNSIKAIAAKMIWYKIQNSTNVYGEIASESLGAYSVTYKDSGVASFNGYPNSLISGLKRVGRAW
jgi:hypothetical protein